MRGKMNSGQHRSYYSAVSLGVVFVAVLMMACCTPNKEGGGRKDGEVAQVRNEPEPTGPPLRVEFLDDLSLHEESWWPTQLDVDGKGNIYVFFSKDRILRKYDPQGNETLRKAAPKGQGPGQFQLFDFCFAPDGRMFVFDMSQRRQTIFDCDLNILDIRKIDLWGDQPLFDLRSQMYLLQLKFLPQTRDRQLLVLTRCTSAAEPLGEVHGYEWGSTRDNITGIYHSDAYRPQIKFALDSGDNLFYAMSDLYTVHTLSPNGRPLKLIRKEGASRRLTQEEITGFKPKTPNSRSVTDIPDRVPYIAGLFVLEGDYLLAVTFESRAESAFLVGDLFDSLGVYRARVEVPKYDDWDFLMAPRGPNAVCRNGWFYTIESDPDGEKFWVKRYRIVITEDR